LFGVEGGGERGRPQGRTSIDFCFLFFRAARGGLLVCIWVGWGGGGGGGVWLELWI